MCLGFWLYGILFCDGLIGLYLKSVDNSFLCNSKVRNDSNLVSHYPRYGDFQTCDFFKVLLKLKMHTKDQLQFFLGAKTQLEIIHISQSHSPRHGDVLLISRFSWNSKWPSWINFIYFVGARTKILKSEIIQILHPPRYGDVQVIFIGLTEIQNGCHWSTWQFFCVRKNLKVRNYTNFTITFPTIWRCGKKKFQISYFEHACPK